MSRCSSRHKSSRVSCCSKKSPRLNCATPLRSNAGGVSSQHSGIGRHYTYGPCRCVGKPETILIRWPRTSILLRIDDDVHGCTGRVCLPLKTSIRTNEFFVMRVKRFVVVKLPLGNEPALRVARSGVSVLTICMSVMAMSMAICRVL